MHLKKLIPILTISLLTQILVGCMSPDEKSIAEAKKLISEQLKDPPSARFTNIYVIRKSEKPTGSLKTEDVFVCGWVDGKNSFGGYTGGTRFVVKLLEGEIGGSKFSQAFTVKLEDSDKSTFYKNKETVFERVYWNDYCVDSTHPATYTGKRI